MIDELQAIDLPKIVLLGRNEWGYSCTLSIVPDRLVYSTIPAGDDNNIISVRACIEVRSVECDAESFHILSSVEDSLFVSELRRLEASIRALRDCDLSEATVQTFEGRCAIAIRTMSTSLSGLLEVAVEFLVPSANRKEPLTYENGWRGSVCVQFITDQSYLGLAQRDICSVLRCLGSSTR